jgi:hypothetical protein
MPESSHVTVPPDRVNKPALPPFGGAVPPVSPLLRPATDLRGRQTLPPFFAPVRRGGPLPGATSRRVRVETPPPSLVSHLTPPEPQATPAAPSWDTPPMPVFAAPAILEAPVLPGLDDEPEVPTEYAIDVDWAPRAMPPVEAPSDGDAPIGAVPPAEVEPSAIDVAPEAPATVPAYELPPAHVELLATQQGSVVPPAPPTMRPAFPGGAQTVLPPTLFADMPLGAPETVEEAESGFSEYVTETVRSDDITSLFAEPYVPTPPPLAYSPAAAARRPVARRTPVLGTPRVDQTPSGQTRAQMAARIGRRATPVLGSQAITPMHVPVIRRTPLAGAIAAIEPAPSDALPTPLPLVSLSPTPVAVPVLQDIAASRAVAHALETVAARVRAGQLVIAGDVPIGDDVSALAAGIAAALAALLGVQR